MTIDFKSVGIKTATVIQNTLSSSLAPVGIKTPLRIATNGDGIFGMNFSVADQVHDNLRNLLLTNHGERLGLYDFGADLSPLTFELNSHEFNFDDEAVVRIKTAVSRYMPFVDLQTFESKIDNVDNKTIGKVQIRVAYSLPALQVKNKIIEVTLYVGG